MFGGSMFDDDPFFGGGGGRDRGDRSRGGRGDQLAHRSNRREDPFSMMEGMMGGFGGMGNMMMPFGRGGGDPFSGFDLMDMGNRGGGNGGGQFSCQTMVMSSRMGPDGKMVTEKFASSSAGDSQRNIHERQQAYSNSATGMDKMSMERQMGQQGRKVIKERTRGTQDEKQTDLYRGMEEHESGAFDERWNQAAAPYMPRHGGFPMHRMTGLEDSAYRRGHAPVNAIEDQRNRRSRNRN